MACCWWRVLVITDRRLVDVDGIGITKPSKKPNRLKRKIRETRKQEKARKRKRERPGRSARWYILVRMW
jgi:hypothetical protein